VQPALGDPASAGGLDWVTHRGPFQPQPFCDSVTRGHRLMVEKSKKTSPACTREKSENFQAFWMKGVFKPLPSEETGRAK